MNGKNLIRGIVWLIALVPTAALLFVFFQTTHGEDYDVSPNQLAVLLEVAGIALLSVFFWFFATNRSEAAWLSNLYGFIASHGFLATFIYSVLATLIAFMAFVACPSVVSKDGYSSFMVPVPFIPLCVSCILAFLLPPVQVGHWTRKNEMLLTVLLEMIRWLLIVGMAMAAAWMFWYSF